MRGIFLWRCTRGWGGLAKNILHTPHLYDAFAQFFERGRYAGSRRM